MSEEREGTDATQSEAALLSRLRLIEDQPLKTRAEAYAHVHEELRDALDAADRRRGDQQGAADRQGGR
ncbi:hypothetical protein ACFOYW_16760 [Gryllotalpicola reticulitermitis]|uniref:Uncharacterized protein n=1 Tax=Gryllotalpicola reticulitermitis TaxID=1184153 RepID=A0ABV8Q9H3_9MICO